MKVKSYERQQSPGHELVLTFFCTSNKPGVEAANIDEEDRRAEESEKENSGQHLVGNF